tara:strand:+ start:1185 stop:1694 length:510 start_codon:yes stop_codon:yes gene_type:complete
MKKNQTDNYKINASLNYYKQKLYDNEINIRKNYGGFDVLNLLFDPKFVKKFNRALDIYTDTLLGSDKLKQIEMAQMLLRAYEAAFEQIKIMQIQKLDPGVTTYTVDGHIYYVFEKQDYLESVKEKLPRHKNMSYISIEELLRCMPKGIREMRESLSELDPTIKLINHAN